MVGSEQSALPVAPAGGGRLARVDVTADDDGQMRLSLSHFVCSETAVGKRRKTKEQD